MQLLLIRVGVSIGEAGCIPPAYSLIADYFTRAERPRAVAIFLLGGNLSFAIGYFLAGWLNDFYGWRVTFALLGLPGLIPAALTWLTLREPRCNRGPLARRGATTMPTEPSLEAAQPQPTVRQVGASLLASTTFRHLLLSFAVASFFASGILRWLPSFFIRSYHIPTGQLGTWFGLIWGLGGFFGTYLGGELACIYAANNERLQLKGMALAYCAFAAFSACIYLTCSSLLALGCMGLAVIGVAMTNGPILAIVQTLVPSRMHATSIAIIYLCSNLVGMGLGPLVLGALSDALQPHFGGQSLRYALTALSPGYLWGAWHLWRASKAVTLDIEAVQGKREQKAFA